MKGMESSASQLACWNCPFTSITQKGLAIHLQKVHRIKSDKAPTRCAKQRPRRPTPKRQSMNAAYWSAPYSCALCSFRCETKVGIYEHVQMGFHQPSFTNKMDMDHRAYLEGQAHSKNSDPNFRTAEAVQEGSGILYQTQPFSRAVYNYSDQGQFLQGQPRVSYISQEQATMHGSIDEAMAELQSGLEEKKYPGQESLAQGWPRINVQNGPPMNAAFQYVPSNSKRNIWSNTPEGVTYWPTQSGTVPIVLKKEMLSHNTHNEDLRDRNGMETSQDVQVTSTADPFGKVIPCSECGCHRRGGCVLPENQQNSSNENKIIFIDQDNLGEASGVEEVYHLEGDSELGVIRAANVTQVVTEGDHMVLDYRTDDGRQLILRAVRADQIPQNREIPVVGQAAENKISEEEKPDVGPHKNITVSLPDTAVSEESSAPAQLPPSAEEGETLQQKLPELFPELFDTAPVHQQEGEETPMSWSQDREPGQPTDTSTSDLDETAHNSEQGYTAISKPSDVISALSRCREVKSVNDSVVLKCYCCPFETKDSACLQSHVKDHVTSFKCTLCDFTAEEKSSILEHKSGSHSENLD